jgi:hypothetical protein
MSQEILAFLQRVDDELSSVSQPGQRLDLYQLGRSALVLHFGFSLSTRDVDFVSMQDLELERIVIAKFGEGTPAARALGMYVDPVQPGLPPLPAGFRQRSQAVVGDWKVLQLWKLEVHDIAASKLKRFHAGDREDIQGLCDRGLLDPLRLRAALEQAFQFSLPGKDDEDDPGRVAAFNHLQRVEKYLSGELGPGIAL